MVQSSSGYDPNRTEAAFTYRDLPVGAKIKLNNGAVAEITGNPGDGAWLLIRFVEHPAEPSRVGEEDMVFFMDVAGRGLKAG